MEHHWSPASSKLSSVVFSPLENEDDNCAPALQSGLNTETIRQKEKIVFDGSIKSLSDKYWIDFSYDGFPVTYNLFLSAKIDDYDRVKTGIKSPFCDIHQYSDITAEFKSMHDHSDRHLNEVIFIKCNKLPCCQGFNGKSKRFPSLLQNSNYKGHCNTFL